MAAPSHVSNHIHKKTGSFIGSNTSFTYAETVTTSATISSGNKMVLIIAVTAAGNTQTLHLPTSTNNSFLSSWTNVGSVTNAAGGYDYVSKVDSGSQANDDVYYWVFTKDATSSSTFSETIDLTQTSGTSFSFNGRFFYEVQEWSDLDSVEFLTSQGKINDGATFSYSETASFAADDIIVLHHYNDDDDGGDNSTVTVQAATTGVVKLHSTVGQVGSVRSECYYKVLTGSSSNTAVVYDDNDTSSPDSSGFGKSLFVFKYVQATSSSTSYSIETGELDGSISGTYDNLTKDFQYYPGVSFTGADSKNTVSISIDRTSGDVNGFSGGFWNSRATYFQDIPTGTATLKTFTYTNSTSSAAVVDVWISQAGIRQAPPEDSDDVIQGYDFSTEGFVDDGISVTGHIDLGVSTATGTYTGEDTTMTIDGSAVKSLENGTGAKVPFNNVYAADTDNDCTIFLQIGDVPASGTAFPIAENNSSTADLPDYYALSSSGASIKTSAETISSSTGWSANQLRVVTIERGGVTERVNGTATTMSGSITADFKMEALYEADASATINSSSGLQIVEMYIMDHALDDAAGSSIEKMEAYFAQKYSTESNYPSGHLCQTAQSYTAYDHSPTSLASGQVFGSWGGSVNTTVNQEPIIITLGKAVGINASNSVTVELNWE